MSWLSSIGLCWCIEDAGGEPLQRPLLDPPMGVGRFLRLAIGIAMAPGKQHERGLVHKDIKPVNILVNSATGDARLTGSTLHLACPASDRRASLPRIAGCLAGGLCERN
jgi:serine/threonine protein kinase